MQDQVLGGDPRGELAVDTPEIGRRLDRLENLLRLVIAAIVFAAMVVGGALLWGPVPWLAVTLVVASVIPLGFALSGLARRSGRRSGRRPVHRVRRATAQR